MLRASTGRLMQHATLLQRAAAPACCALPAYQNRSILLTANPVQLHSFTYRAQLHRQPWQGPLQLYSQQQQRSAHKVSGAKKGTAVKELDKKVIKSSTNIRCDMLHHHQPQAGLAGHDACQRIVRMRTQ